MSVKSLCKSFVVAVLTWEAKLLLRRTRPTVIAITGSVGKTSTKDAIFAALQGHISTRKSEKSFNSELGVPLSVLGLRNAWNNPFLWVRNLIDGLLTVIHPGDYPKVLVLEVGVDHPGDMRKLTQWLAPDVVVVTRLPDVPVHVEFFATPQEVINEKLLLVKALKPDGVLIYNQDDEIIRQHVAEVRQKSIGFSRYSPSDFTASGDVIVYEGGVPVGMEFTLTHQHIEAVMRVSGSLGVQHAYNYAAAVAAASLFSVSLVAATQALTTHVPPPGRMRIIKGLKDTYIIDDSYNSSPVAAERAVATFAEVRGFQRKIVVLGDMMELGQYSVQEHKVLGKQVAEVADVLVTIGVRARGIATGALHAGLSEKVIYQYDKVDRAANELQLMLRPGDVVLIKASESVRAERVVMEIMAEPDRAGELLVRQHQAWLDRPPREA